MKPLNRTRIVWADGCEFDYLGQRTRLVLDPTQATGHQVQAGAGGLPTLRLQKLFRHDAPSRMVLGQRPDRDWRFLTA